jgi:hypothetical protein
MSWTFTKEDASGVVLIFTVFIPYISIGKAEIVQVGENTRVTTFNFPTELTIKETKKSLGFTVKLLGVGFELYFKI